MIKKNKVVTISFVLTDVKGEVLDKAPKTEPYSYLHGHGQMVEGLEKALENLNEGDAKKVVLPPETGYGQIDERLFVEIDRKQFPKNADIKPDMEFVADVGVGGKRSFVVKEVIGDAIRMDGNHPLAGQTLTFDVLIHKIRDATQDELAHGHAHGEGGHHHH